MIMVLPPVYLNLLSACVKKDGGEDFLKISLYKVLYIYRRMERVVIIIIN